MSARMIAILIPLCIIILQINVTEAYEIKCSNGEKQTLSCVFNYLPDNSTLSSEMPSDFRPFTKYITHLTLGIANLTTLPNDTFNLLPNLNSLSARADIHLLTQRTFKNASKLSILNFGYNNRLTKLEKRLFKNAPSLEYIDLGFNQIVEIEDKAFGGLKNLKLLRLEANLIEIIRNKTFANLKNLLRLDLSKNAIGEVENRAFSRLSKLKILQMNQNRLERLPSGLFSGCRAIERIDLSVNPISDVEEGVFNGLDSLRFLEMGFNRLMTLPDWFFDGMPNLHSLFLAQNQLQELPVKFSSLIGLSVVDLSYNPLKTIDPELIFNLTKLESLELRGCNLTTLDLDLFDNKLALETLDLSENNLTTIDWNVFEPLQKLKFLKLEANFISELENYTDIKSFLPALEFINLARNEIDCDTVLEMIDYFRNNTVEYEFGEEVDVGCRLLPIQTRAIQAYKLSNAKFNEEALRFINF